MRELDFPIIALYSQDPKYTQSKCIVYKNLLELKRLKQYKAQLKL